MAKSIGPGGYLEVQLAELGAERNVRLVPFHGRSDTGFIANPNFRKGEQPAAYVSVTTGQGLPSTAFTGVVTGGISQSYTIVTDTGSGATAPVDLSGQIVLAVVTDTGTAGPY